MIFRWRPGREPSSILLSRPLLGAIAQTARPYLRRIVLLALLITGGTLLPLSQPLLYRFAIDNLVARRPFEEILALALAAAAATVVGILLTYAYTNAAASLGRRIIADLQLQMFDRLAAMPLEFFTTVRGGAAGARLTTDVYATEPLFTRVLVALVANVLTLIGALAVLVYVDIRLALPLLAIPLLFRPWRATEEKINQLVRAQQALNTDLATAAESVLSTPGMTLARQSGELPREINRFKSTIEELRSSATTQVELHSRITTGYNLTFGVVTSVMFLGGAWLVSNGDLSLGTLVLFLLYIRQVQVPVATLGGLRFEALRAVRAFDRVFEILHGPGGSDLRSSNGSSRATDFIPTVSGTRQSAGVSLEAKVPERTTQLEFENVAFHYRSVDELAISSLSQAPSSIGSIADEPRSHGPEIRLILDGVSFAVARGELVAIVGASGAGKSTISMLAAGLYRPTRGIVRVAGISTEQWTDSELARRAALITQDTYVLHDTVRGNLRYVNERATDSDISSACDAAHLSALVASLPDGLDTLVGERGYRLSGGERQRLAIARALLKKADLIILDEPTSQLDAETELLIKATTTELFADKAVLTIAHRLSTIVDADRILVLHDGKITEEGTHDDLMALPHGRYAALYRAQVRGAR